MARLRKNRPAPPRTVHIQITELSHEYLTLRKHEDDEPLYNVLERLLNKIEKMELDNAALRLQTEVRQETPLL